ATGAPPRPPPLPYTPLFRSETVQRDGICSVAIAPAPGLPDELRSAVQATALRLAEHLDVTGVMALELFEVIGSDGRPGVLVNERSEEHTSELQSRENLVCRL